MGPTHNREHGAAHVNIFFFLIMLVMFLGALAFGYFQLTDNVKLEERAKATAGQNIQLAIDIQLRDDYIAEIRGLIGDAGQYAGGKTSAGEPIVYVLPGEPGELIPLENVALPDNIRATISAFHKKAEISETMSTPLATLLGEVEKKLTAKDKLLADKDAAAKTLATQIASAQNAASESDRQKQAEIAKLDQEKNELRQTIDAEYNKLNVQIDGLREEVQRRREEMDTASEDQAAQLLAMQNEANMLRARIAAQADKFKLVNPPEEADGAVLSSSQAAGRAWINLGKKDMLPRGTVFLITNPNSNAVKGYGRVSKVDYDRSEIDLFDIVDRYDPIAKGDEISNAVYSPNVRRNIYLLGRFSYPLTKPMVKLTLEKLGNKVHDSVGPGVDLVLVGADTLNDEGDGFTPVTESEDYQKALSLQIEIATLNKVRDFLKLGDD